MDLLIRYNRLVQNIMLVLAAVAVALGWLWVVQRPQPLSPWRLWVAQTCAVYLTASLPIYVLEFDTRIRLAMEHPWLWTVKEPWAGPRGFALAWLAWLCSFTWRGRARIAFVVGSMLLLFLRGSIHWL